MRIDVSSFKGEAPRVAPRLLPNDMGQATSNPRLISGNLEAWKAFANGQAGQAIAPNPISIFYMNDQLWLTWPFMSGGGSLLLMPFDTSINDYYGRVLFTIQNGSPALSSVQSKFGGSSLFVPTGASIITSGTLPSTYNFGTGDFTFEGWIYLSGADQPILEIEDPLSVNASLIQITITGGALWVAVRDSGGTTTHSGAIGVSTGAWHAWSVSRKSGTLRSFVDGVVDINAADTHNLLFGGEVMTIGNVYGLPPDTSSNTYFDEIRISPSGLYTSNYTPATSAFPLDPNLLSPTATEVDVAKEAIAGDTSWRTIFCGTDAPRFTDLGLASGLLDGSGHPITGSSTVAANAGPYPINSRKLGVPNPTAAPSAAIVPAAAGSNAVSYVDTFDSTTINWNLAPSTAYTGSAFVVVGGNPGAYMQVQSIGGHEAISYKNFAIDPTQNFTVAFDLSYLRQSNAHLQPSFMDFFVAMDSSLSGSVVRIENKSTGVTLHFASVTNGVIGADIGTYSIASGSIPNWHTDADATYSGFIQNTQWAHVTLAVAPQVGATTNCTITLTVAVGGVMQFTQAQAGMPNAGTYQGVGCYDPVEAYPDWIILKVDNFAVSGTGPAAASTSLEATTYVYTLVNDLGEESGPSPVLANTDGSDTITRTIGQAVSVTLPGTLAATGADASYFQVAPSGYIPTVQLNGTTPSPSMNLYRAVTGSAGTEFLLVAANIAFAGGSATTYTDSIADAALSEALQSTLWYPPPVNMVGIRALPNGIYTGFAGNILCLSAQGIPHAWPIAYQLAFDFPIVGVENVDTTVVLCTSNYPYLASGATPDAYSQTKATYPHACASKRSIQYLQNVGVVFATFEGLVAIAGPGQERLLTANLFSKREWLALNPSSMISAVNDNRYFCSYRTTGGVSGAFYVDVSDFAGGKVSMGFHFTARYNDPLSDTLYVIRDGIAGYPTIEGFDTDPANLLSYSWKSKQFYVGAPASFKAARVTSETYANTVMTLFADGRQYAQFAVPSQVEFMLPPPPGGLVEKYFEFQLAGTDTVDRVQVAEDFEELAA